MRGFAFVADDIEVVAVLAHGFDEFGKACLGPNLLTEQHVGGHADAEVVLGPDQRFAGAGRKRGLYRRRDRGRARPTPARFAANWLSYAQAP